MACVHEEFCASVNVGRISDGEGGPITHYMADVTIQCAQCKEAFCFIGMERGSDFGKPMMDVLGDEARLPIRPSSEANKDLRLPAVAGYRIRQA